MSTGGFQVPRAIPSSAKASLMLLENNRFTSFCRLRKSWKASKRTLLITNLLLLNFCTLDFAKHMFSPCKRLPLTFLRWSCCGGGSQRPPILRDQLLNSSIGFLRTKRKHFLIRYNSV